MCESEGGRRCESDSARVAKQSNAQKLVISGIAVTGPRFSLLICTITGNIEVLRNDGAGLESNGFYSLLGIFFSFG